MKHTHTKTALLGVVAAIALFTSISYASAGEIMKSDAVLQDTIQADVASNPTVSIAQPTEKTRVTLNANDISAGVFGANTGGGNYTFPATLTTSKLRIGTASSTNVFDSYDVWGSHLYFAGNGDNTLHIENTYQPGAEAGIYLTNYNEGQSLSISTNAGSYGPSIVGYPNLVLQDGNAGGVISLSTEAFNVDGRWTLLGATTQVFKVTDNTSQLLVVTRGGQVQVASGNATLPAYSYVTDHNTGSFNPGTNIWAVSTNATERMRVGSTGNVGIGTTTANFPLTVAGTIYSSSGGFKFPDGTVQTTAASDKVGGSVPVGEPVATKCINTSQVGQLTFGPSTQKLYLCTGAKRGWVTVMLEGL